MKIRLTILMAVMTLLLLGTLASAQSNRPAQSLDVAVQAVMIQGGSYQLTSSGSPIGDTSSGGAYRLLTLAASSPSRANGCCCVYAPCVMR
jgi:hypothetical protein